MGRDRNEEADREAVPPITELMREQDRELERMINRDRRLLVVLTAFVIALFAAGAALWAG